MAIMTKDLKIGESMVIGDAVVKLEEKSGQIARLSIRAPRDVRVKIVKEEGKTSLLE